MPPLAARGVDPQLDGEAGAIHAGLQRAQLIRQRLGQHRDDAIGKIDRIAAPLGLTVEGAAGPHIPGDVGDRDDEVPAAAVLWVEVRLGPHRVVEIAGVAAVDRDQRDIAQIGSSGRGDRQCRLGFGERRGRKFGRDVIGGNRQQAYRAGVRGGTQPFDDTGSRRAEPSRDELLGDDQFPFAGAARVVRRDPIFVAVTPVGRHQPAALAGVLEGPDDPLTGAVEPADDPRFDVAGFEWHEPCRGPLADLQHLARPALDDAQERRRFRPRPGDRAGERQPILVAAYPLDNGHLGKRRGGDKAPVGGAGDGPGTLDIAQHVAQLRAIARRYGEGASDLALADRGGALADEGEKLGRRRQIAAAVLSENYLREISPLSGAMSRIEVEASSPSIEWRWFLLPRSFCCIGHFRRRGFFSCYDSL